MAEDGVQFYWGKFEYFPPIEEEVRLYTNCLSENEFNN